MLHRALHCSVTLLVISVSVLVTNGLPGLAAQEHNSAITIRGLVVNEAGKPLPQMLVRCEDNPWPEEVLLEDISDEKGAFKLTIPAKTGPLTCTSGGSIYEPSSRLIPVRDYTQVVFTLNFRTIPILEGWITSRTGGSLPFALVQVSQNGVTFSSRADANGRARFENLKAGPARVEYSADGYTPMSKDRVLLEGSDLSVSLEAFGLPTGFVLLIPALLVLGLRASLELIEHRSSKVQASDLNPLLILTCLVSWGGVLLWLWRIPGGDETISFFNPRLAFSLSVPAFGFVGAMVFVIDIFQQGQQNATSNHEKEFALRLVLGPYAAIVMVLLLKDTFKFAESLEKLETQAALAFFSGFLVVLVLQGLAEKGNEILGQWRASSRYEPSQIARTFKLDQEEDLKLKKANMKYLAQLRTLSEEQLQMLAGMTDLSEGFLIALQKRLQPDHLYAMLGKETWEKLNQAGVWTVWEIASLSPERLQQICHDRHLDQEILTRFYQDCKAFVDLAKDS